MKTKTVARWNGAVIAIGGIAVVLIGGWGLTKTPFAVFYMLLGLAQLIVGIGMYRWGKHP